MIYAVPYRYARRFLGVRESDPEFPAVAFHDAARSVVDRLQQDCAQLNENLLIVSATLQPDEVDGRRYTLATQSPPIANLMRAVSLQLESARGMELDELPLSQAQVVRGQTYSLLGPETARVVQTSESVRAGAALFLSYIAAPAEVSSETDTVPAFIPDGFADLMGYLIAEMLWPQGGEAVMPRDQVERMEDRLGQLYERWGKATPTVARRREHGDGVAPYLF